MMPKDLSPELNLAFWEVWFLEVCNMIPQGNESWSSHCLDSLQAYTMGGEL
jgi:hypothetical protein